jgi:hypothetical protein
VEFKTKVLHDAIGLAGRFTNKRSPVGLCRSVMLHPKPTGLSIEAGGSEGAVRIFVEGEGRQTLRDSVAVQHTLLSSLAGTLSGDHTSVGVSGNMLCINSGGTDATIETVDATGWMVSDGDFDCDYMVNFRLAEAADCARSVSFACATNDPRFANAEVIKVSDGRMQFMAGDSKVSAASWVDGVDGELVAMIPPSWVLGAMSCLSHGGSKTARVGTSGGMVIFESDLTKVRVPTVAQGIMCKDSAVLSSLVTSGNGWDIDRDELIKFCMQVAAVSNDFSTAVLCKPEGNSLTLEYSGVCFSDRSKDAGATCKRTIAGKCEGDAVHVSYLLLRQIINSASSEDFMLWQGSKFIGVTCSGGYVAACGLLSPERAAANV